MLVVELTEPQFNSRIAVLLELDEIWVVSFAEVVAASGVQFLFWSWEPKREYSMKFWKW